MIGEEESLVWSWRKEDYSRRKEEHNEMSDLWRWWSRDGNRKRTSFYNSSRPTRRLSRDQLSEISMLSTSKDCDVRECGLYSTCSLILSHCQDLTIGMVWLNLGGGGYNNNSTSKSSGVGATYVSCCLCESPPFVLESAYDVMADGRRKSHCNQQKLSASTIVRASANDVIPAAGLHRKWWRCKNR